jgi:hypothetical protein
LDCYAARVDNAQLGFFGRSLDQAAGAKQRDHLLALVLIHLAAEGLNAECFHDAL